EAIRFQAMAALKEGRSKTEVARLFGVTRQAIHGWVKRKRQAGIKGLRARRRGRPVGGRLQPKQKRLICRLITDHCPDQLKLPFYLWTREAVAHLMAQRCGMRLSVWTVGRFLARWGVHAAEAVAAGFRARPQRGRRLAAPKVSGHPRLGPPAERTDFLGGRNGIAGRPCRRTLFQPARPDAGDSGHGAALWL